MTMTEESLSALDRHVAPGLRLWMLIALVSGVLMVMVVLVCCFMRIRIPRTKRQIELIAAKRKMRKERADAAKRGLQTVQPEERPQTIVMNTLASRGPSSSRSLVPTGRSTSRSPAPPGFSGATGGHQNLGAEAQPLCSSKSHTMTVV